MSPVSIVHLCRTGWPARGGMEAVVQQVAHRQVADGWRVTVVTLDHGPAGRELVDATHEGVRYRRLPRWGTPLYAMARGVRGALAGADIVHVHGIDGLVDQALRHRPEGGRVVLSTHGGYLHTRRLWPLKQLMLRTWTPWSLRRLDGLWWTSAQDRDRMAAMGLAGMVVPNGLELRSWLALDRRPEAGRWLLPGRVDRHKGHLDALQALAAMPVAARPRLRIVGPVADEAFGREVVGRAVSLGLQRVELVGEVELPALLDEFARAEVCLLPSEAEGFGLTLVEAMAAGVPVAARGIDAFRERGGDVPWWIPFGTDAAGAALQAIRPDAVRLQRGRTMAAAHDWDEVFPLWRAAYDAEEARP